MWSRETQKPTDMEGQTKGRYSGADELRRSQLWSISQISMTQSTFYMIYMVVTGFWFHDRNILNCFIAVFYSVCRMGGTEFNLYMI
jgi:hypothetical protein